MFKVGEHKPSTTNSGERWNRICNVIKHPDHKGDQIERVSTTDQRLELYEYDENDIAVLTLCTELKFEPVVI